MEDLSSHEFFQSLKNSLPSEYRNGINLIEFKDGILYAWNQADSCIITLNIEFQLKHSKQYPVQILRLINPPVFEVEWLLINKTNTLCAVIGPKGLGIVRIPRRWGPDGIFEGGKPEISCRCHTLDEPYFVCKSTKTVKQVRWHPASPNFTHLVVLTTEDTLRLYNAQDMTLKTVWHPGRACLSSSMSQVTISRGSGLRTLASLGETYIDFDFTPPVIVGDAKSAKSGVDWPMLLLRGNGDVFVLTASLENKKKVKIDGPLPVYPPDDNCGMEDACSMMVLRSCPPVVAIATSSGNVYHSLLLSFNDNDEQLNESVETDTIQPYHSNAGLYIFECIELELGVSLDDNAELYSCPISLYPDPHVSSRYFCLHEAGLHAIILPIVSDLNKYAKCSEDDADQYLPSLRHSQSQLEYLICTRINADDPTHHFSSPLIGFSIAEMPCFLIAFSLNGEPTTLPLISITALQETKYSSAAVPASDENYTQDENFSAHIRDIVRPASGSSRPVFKIDSKVPLAPETYAEISNQEIDGLREEYFNRYHLAIKDVEKRIKLLSIMKEKQSEEVNDIEKKYNDMRAKGEKLKKMCDSFKQRQDLFSSKSHSMLEKLKQKQPQNTAVQKRVLEKLREYNNTVQKLSTKVEEACKKQQYQEEKIKETVDKFENTNFYLSGDQQTVIADNLSQMGEEISKLKNAQTKVTRTADMLLEKFDKH